MTSCKFCNGEWIESDGIGQGEIQPVGIMLARLSGKWPSGHGVRLDEDKYLMFDNSCGEYVEGAVRIAYCPFCGRKMEDNR